jgi:hypothetical protein
VWFSAAAICVAQPPTVTTADLPKGDRDRVHYLLVPSLAVSGTETEQLKIQKALLAFLVVILCTHTMRGVQGHGICTTKSGKLCMSLYIEILIVFT